MMKKHNIALVDDEKLFTVGLKLIIERDTSLQVNFICHDGVELINHIKDNKFDSDVILLDISMPVLDGVETLLALQKIAQPFKVIILSSHYNESIIIRLLDEGASAFLAKNENPAIVVETIKNVIKNGFHIDHNIMKMLGNRRLIAKNHSVYESLSQRESEILILVCEEYTNKEIAEKLFISQRTVEGHRNRILEKTGAKNTAGMVIYAIEHQLIDVNITKYG